LWGYWDTAFTNRDSLLLYTFTMVISKIIFRFS
jgi:hypothetical protein